MWQRGPNVTFRSSNSLFHAHLCHICQFFLLLPLKNIFFAIVLCRLKITLTVDFFFSNMIYIGLLFFFFNIQYHKNLELNRGVFWGQCTQTKSAASTQKVGGEALDEDKALKKKNVAQKNVAPGPPEALVNPVCKAWLPTRPSRENCPRYQSPESASFAVIKLIHILPQDHNITVSDNSWAIMSCIVYSGIGEAFGSDYLLLWLERIIASYYSQWDSLIDPWSQIGAYH